jgi:HAD superfamily hydrolase (TIGR01509 family)
MIKTVYFDLGNVLIFFSFPKMLSQMSECTGMTVDEIQKLLFQTSVREQYEKGEIHTEDLYRLFLKSAPRPFTLHEFLAAFSNIFTPNTELWPLVEALKEKGIRLLLLSNTSECHFNYVYSHYPILRLFDHHILSYEVGSWKPDLQIFQKALQHAECTPEECFYTDDVPEFIHSARKAGLPGEVFTDVATLKAHLIARDPTIFEKR